MKIIKRLLFNYWWTKGEKALKKGDYEMTDCCHEKIRKYIWRVYD